MKDALNYALRDPQDKYRTGPLALLNFAGSMIVFLLGGVLVLVICTAILMLLFGLGVPRFAIVGILLLATVTAGCARATRKQRGYRVLAYVEQSVRANLPLPPMIRAAAESERGAIRRRLEQLEYHLVDGAMLSDALARAVPETTDKTIALIHSAERNGNLSSVLHQIVDDYRAQTPNVIFNLSFQKVYAVSLFGIVGLVTWAVMIFVMPKFKAIAHDFGMNLPPVTIWLLEWGVSVVSVIAILGFFLALLLLIQVGRDTFSPRLRIGNPLRDLLDMILWPMPLVGAMQRDRGLTDVCRVLAAATRVGRPLPAAIVEAAQPHLNSILRGRLLRWAEGIANGAEISYAARAAKLPGLFTGTLASARGSENLPAAFDFLARCYHTRFSRAMILIQNSFLPLMAVSMGLLVMFIALSIFMPMIGMLNSIAAPRGSL